MPKNSRQVYLNKSSLAAAIFAATAIAAFLLSSYFDLFEKFSALSHKNEAWQLDELMSVLVISTLAGFAFSIRRSRELRTELRRRLEAEARIVRLAMHDPLTGLVNRRKMHDVLAAALLARKTGDEVTGLLLIDLDRFKPINDTHGHAVGDQLLKAVADRLQAIVREGEVVARLGGDEFALVLPRLAKAEAAGRPARRLIRALTAPFEIGDLVLRIGASIGVATSSDTTIDPAAFIHHADIALYRAKREGRGGVRFFEAHMDREVRDRARLELEFRQALADGAITPYFQPLVELSTGKIKGYELLARWLHPTDGVIMPDLFIPMAEDTGLIGEMCLQILREGCRAARSWPGRPILALNIAPTQLRDAQLPDKLLAILAETGFEPDRLEVEITENALVEDFQAAKTLLLSLKARGVRIALDDFGTGYSSLNHLRQLPFDKLKIDRSFVMAMQESEESRKIVDAIVSLSHSLGLEIVAEGIEDSAAAEHLSRLGCEFGQGFLYGRPAPGQAADASLLRAAG